MSLNLQPFYDLTQEFDYIKLLELLKNYSYPRDQITKLIRTKKILRIKKGLYVLGPEFRKPYSSEILANMIYGPSYVSGLSALSFYSAIPERISVISSRTPNRHKIFNTPVGRFTYDFLPMKQYRESVDRIELDGQRSFMIATREKALLELYVKVEEIESTSDLKDWIRSMRIDEDFLVKLRLNELTSLCRVFPEKQVGFLIEIVRKAKHE